MVELKTDFSIVHSNLDKELTNRIATFIAWVSEKDPNKGIELNDLMYELEQEVFDETCALYNE